MSDGRRDGYPQPNLALSSLRTALTHSLTSTTLCSHTDLLPFLEVSDSLPVQLEFTARLASLDLLMAMAADVGLGFEAMGKIFKEGMIFFTKQGSRERYRTTYPDSRLHSYFHDLLVLHSVL